MSEEKQLSSSFDELTSGGADSLRRSVVSRDGVISELVESEKTYVESLKVLKDVWFTGIKSLKKRAPEMPIFDILDGFNKQFLPIFALNEKILEDLLSSTNPTLKFCGYVKALTIYSFYCGQYPKVLDALFEAEQVAWFANELQAIGNRTTAKGVDFHSALLAPFQRIGAYNQILNDLVGVTEESHPDYPRLKDAMLNMVSVYNKINENKKLFEHQAEAVKLQMEFQGQVHILEPTRRFVYRENITLIELQPQFARYELILFNDLIIIAGLDPTTSKLKFLFDLSFDSRTELIALENPASRKLNEAFHLCKNSRKSFLFSASMGSYIKAKVQKAIQLYFSSHGFEGNENISESLTSLPEYLLEKFISRWNFLDCAVWLHCKGLTELVPVFNQFRISGLELARLSYVNLTFDMLIEPFLARSFLRAQVSLVVQRKHELYGSDSHLSILTAKESVVGFENLADFVTVPSDKCEINPIEAEEKCRQTFCIRIFLGKNSESKELERHVVKNYLLFEQLDSQVRDLKGKEYVYDFPTWEKFQRSLDKSSIFEHYLQHICADPVLHQICASFLNLSDEILRKVKSNRDFTKTYKDASFQELFTSFSESSSISSIQTGKFSRFVPMTRATLYHIMLSLNFGRNSRKMFEMLASKLIDSPFCELSAEKLDEEFPELSEFQVFECITLLLTRCKKFIARVEQSLEQKMILCDLISRLNSSPLSEWIKFVAEEIIKYSLHSDVLLMYLDIVGYQCDLSSATLWMWEGLESSQDFAWALGMYKILWKYGGSKMRFDKIERWQSVAPAQLLIYKFLKTNLKSRFDLLFARFFPASLAQTTMKSLGVSHLSISSVNEKLEWNKFKLKIIKYPELPFTHESVGRISRLFYRDASPVWPSEFCILEKEPILITLAQKIDLKSFHARSIAENDPWRMHSLSSQFDEFNISSLIMLSILVNPANGFPENYAVEADDDNVCRLYWMDCSRVFVKGEDVRCVLFNFDQMNHPVHPLVRKLFLSLTEERFLEDWMRPSLRYAFLACNHLFNGLTEAVLNSEQLKKNGSFFPPVMEVGSCVETVCKLMLIQKLLKDYPKISHREILTVVEPSACPSFHEYYWWDEVKGFEDKKSKFRGIPLSNFIKDNLKVDVDSAEAISEILSLKKQSVQQAYELARMFFDLQKDGHLTTDFSRVSVVQSNSRPRFFQLNMVNGSGDLNRWDSVLSLSILEFTMSIHLRSCIGLNNSLVWRLTTPLVVLESLDLSFCSGVTKIGESESSWEFPRLKKLLMNKMPHLRHCFIKAPIQHFEARECAYLEEVGIISLDFPQLLDLQGSRAVLKVTVPRSDILQTPPISPLASPTAKEDKLVSDDFVAILQDSMEFIFSMFDLKGEELKNGGNATSGIPGKHVTVELMCPKQFLEIQSYFGVKPHQLADSICTGSLGKELSKGKSNSVFLTTEDKRFVMKTINPSEWDFMAKDFLCDYQAYVKHNPDTLLPRFLSCFRISSKGDSRSFIIMNNVFQTSLRVTEVFDLKGSRAHREVTLSELNKGPDRVCYKDLDWDKKQYTIELGSLSFNFLRQAEQDTIFLREHFVMDYSLLVGIHYMVPEDRFGEDLSFVAGDVVFSLDVSDEKEMENFHAKHGRDQRLASAIVPMPEKSRFKKERGGMRGRDDQGNHYPVYYFIGIIDTLQSYNLFKFAEKTLRTAIFPWESDISCTDPHSYQKRFMQRVQRAVRPSPDFDER
jgi:hypothetical protein